ncbi:MAG TPA: hypothetical protein VLV32_07560 [Burkholderiales bacterium]|nr:hypothetical protein [Burkholderiales bacterium]
MSDIQKADPNARRRALLLVIIGTIVGAAIIFGFESYRPALQGWILSEPDKVIDRIIIVMVASGCVLSAPLLVFGAYFLMLGAKVSRAQQYPPPAQPVIRDIVIVRGEAAVVRGKILKILAVCMFAAAVFIPILIWLIALALIERAT